MPGNSQVLDNLEAYVQDKLNITRSLHDRLGLTENSLSGAQTVTVAMVQSNQLTTRIPNNDEDTEPDNNTHKRQRKVCVPADRNRKELTKERQAQVLNNQQEKERLKAQALEDRDKIDKASRTKSKRPTLQPENNSENMDDTNSPRPQKSKGKASHPDQIKSLKKNRRTPIASANDRVPNDPSLDPNTPDEDVLFGNLIDPEDDSDYPVGPDELGFIPSF